MDRRTFLKTTASAGVLSAGALATPAISQRAAARALRLVPHADVANFDPIWTTAYIARNAGLLVWDTLYGVDSKLQPQRQMVESEMVSPDGLVWTFRLRPGLKFHDGEPVWEAIMTDVVVVIGAGSIGQAIARRVSAGKHVLLADLVQKNADSAAKVMSEADFDVSIMTVDISSRASIRAVVKKATSLGNVTGLIHAAGVSPSQQPPEVILKVDLYGTAVLLEEFGSVIAHGGAAVVISSQSGHRLPALAEQDRALATTPADDLLSLPMLQPDKVTTRCTPTRFRNGATRFGSRLKR
jgi:hypothetical protein